MLKDWEGKDPDQSPTTGAVPSHSIGLIKKNSRERISSTSGAKTLPEEVKGNKPIYLKPQDSFKVSSVLNKSPAGCSVRINEKCNVLQMVILRTSSHSTGYTV